MTLDYGRHQHMSYCTAEGIPQVFLHHREFWINEAIHERDLNSLVWMPD